MFRLVSVSWLLQTAVAAWLATAAVDPCSAEERTITYPDGTKRIVYHRNEDGLVHGPLMEFHANGKRKTEAHYRLGQRDGAYKTYFPSGRPEVKAVYKDGLLDGKYTRYDEDGSVVETAVYRGGELQGARQVFDKGRLTREEIWDRNKLLFPKSAQVIAARLAAIAQARVATVGEAPPAPARFAAAVRDPSRQQGREAALRKLMAYRFLCDLPYEDLALDVGYNAHAEAACEILNRVGQLSHEPPNPGLPEEEYQFALLGTKRSNLYVASRTGDSMMVDSVGRYMDDSDAGNIARLGHRRWCLNPAMLRVGFAAAGNYSAMWAHDQGRPMAADYDFMAFPPRGLTPTSMFRESYAWSVSPNPSKYRVVDPSAVKVTVWPVQYDPRRRRLEKAPQSIPLNHLSVSLDSMGTPSCVIFRPANAKVVPDAMYWVEITGLKNALGFDVPIEYLVAFFQLATDVPGR